LAAPVMLREIHFQGCDGTEIQVRIYFAGLARSSLPRDLCGRPQRHDVRRSGRTVEQFLGVPQKKQKPFLGLWAEKRLLLPFARRTTCILWKGKSGFSGWHIFRDTGFWHREGTQPRGHQSHSFNDCGRPRAFRADPGGSPAIDGLTSVSRCCGRDNTRTREAFTGLLSPQGRDDREKWWPVSRAGGR